MWQESVDSQAYPLRALKVSITHSASASENNQHRLGAEGAPLSGLEVGNHDGLGEALPLPPPPCQGCRREPRVSAPGATWNTFSYRTISESCRYNDNIVFGYIRS